MIPRNCSLGTKQFCFGFNNRTECNNLPLNLSNIVPEAVATFVGDQVQALQYGKYSRQFDSGPSVDACYDHHFVLCKLRLSVRIGMMIVFVAGITSPSSSSLSLHSGPLALLPCFTWRSRSPALSGHPPPYLRPMPDKLNSILAQFLVNYPMRRAMLRS
jgi:hypothetical protein